MQLAVNQLDDCRPQSMAVMINPFPSERTTSTGKACPAGASSLGRRGKIGAVELIVSILISWESRRRRRRRIARTTNPEGLADDLKSHKHEDGCQHRLGNQSTINETYPSIPPSPTKHQQAGYSRSGCPWPCRPATDVGSSAQHHHRLGNQAEAASTRSTVAS